MKNSVHTYAGIEYDIHSLRAVKLTPVKNQGEFRWQMEQRELQGDFNKEPELITALKDAVHSLGIKKAIIATTLWGKQAYVTELTPKKGTPSELRTAVQFELRKTVPFDVTTALLEFHEIGEAVEGSDMVNLAVGVVVPQLFNNHVRIHELAEIKPELIDLLPFTICNAARETCLSSGESGTSVILHVGSEVSTLILNDMAVPGSLYHRSIYFSADEIFVKSELSEEEVSRRLMSLVEEVSRTIQFYHKNYSGSVQKCLQLCGVHCNQELLVSTLGHTDFTVVPLNVPSSVATNLPEKSQGTFAIACSLALRVAEGGFNG